MNLDIVLGPIEAWPQFGSETVLSQHAVRVGGAAGNAILALDALDVAARVHGTMGRDDFGEMLVAQLQRHGAELTRVDESTAFTVGIAHPGGERTFFSHLGHLSYFDTESVTSALVAEPNGYLLLCGYFVLPSIRGEKARALLEIAQQHGHTILLDTGWPSEGWTEEVRRELRSLLPVIDIALPNEAELLGWTGSASVEEALEELERSDSRAIVKLGSRGAGWRDSRGQLSICPAPSASVVDSVGAGDAFNAGYIAAIHRGLPMEQAISAAVQTASLAVSTQPRRYPSWKDLELEEVL